MDQFLAGMVAGVIMRRVGVGQGVAWAALLAGFAGIVTVMHSFNIGVAFSASPGLTRRRAAGGSCCRRLRPPVTPSLWWVILNVSLRTLRPLDWLSAAFAWLGTISYSMYLLHALVPGALIRGYFVDIRNGPLDFAGLVFLGIGLSLVVAISSATYLLIEKPFLDLRKPSDTPRAE